MLIGNSKGCSFNINPLLLIVIPVALTFTWKKERSEHEASERKYDYIVVGAGSSGSLLASRLAKETKFDVLLLEAGKAPLPRSNIPAYAGELQHTEMNWGYLWEPQPNFALGLEDYRLPCPRGKALGGSTAISYMVYGRGNRDDLDSWANSGNIGWSFEDLLPYFKRYENYTVKINDRTVHGQNGTVSITDVPYRTKSSRAFVKAMKELGYRYVDYNGWHQVGVSFVHSTIKGGSRVNAFNAFLQPQTNLSGNLKVLTESLVTKILITPSKKAYGVTFIKGGKKFTAYAQKEVIVSAGAFNSPQLLMLSGIGPKIHLKKLGIHLVKDAPVGSRLRDHIGFIGLIYTVNESVTFTSEQLKSKKALTILRKSGLGPLTSSLGIEALAAIDTDNSSTKPNVELVFFGMTLNVDKGCNMRGLYRVSDKIYKQFWKKIEGQPAFMIVPVLYKPKSMGSVRLRHADPSEYPLLHGEFYNDPTKEDLKVMIKAIRIIQKIVRTSAFRRYNATLLTPIPGCRQPLNTDRYWECALRHLPMTFHDPHGTCKMGPENDTKAVVDLELRVRGVKSLRVVDASVFPDVVSGHINGLCYAIGEKIADLIIRGNLKEILIPPVTEKARNKGNLPKRILNGILKGER